MTPETRVEKIVAVEPARLAAAIASPYGLRTWLADEAWSEKRPGGRVVFRWHDGRQLAGRWAEYDAVGPLVCALSTDDGEVSRVTFELTEVAGEAASAATGRGATALTVTTTGPLAAADWNQLVDDLAAYAESGANARLARRPMMGVYPDFPDRDLAEAKGVPLGGVVSGGGAEAAGLTKGDVLTRVADRKVTDWPSLAPALDGLQSGQVVSVGFLRDGEERVVELTLGGRNLPELPESTATLAAAVASGAEEVLERIEKTIASAAEASLAAAPAPGEWNGSQVLAHLIISERYSQLDLVARAGDVPGPEWAEGGEHFLQDALAARPAGDLAAVFAETLRANADLAARIVLSDPDPPVLVAIAEWLDHCREHGADHAAQLEALAAAPEV